MVAAGPGEFLPTQGADTGARGVLWLFLGVVTGIRVAFLAGGGLDLSPDEAHYWEWSRRLDLSYYSKGPLVAYVIYVLTATFGTSALVIRLGAVGLSLVGAVGLYRLGREAFPDARAALLAVIGLQVTPLVWAGSLLMTIDPPFLVLWILTLLCLYRGLVDGRGTAWLAAGCTVGLGLLAKYAMLFVLPGIVLYVWRAPEARRWLSRREPYIAGAVALILFAPVLVWNVRQGWVSAWHVASQGRGRGWSVGTVLDFLGSQVGVLSPLVAGILVWAAWYGVHHGLMRRREPYRFLTAFALPILLFYLLLSLQGKVQANWAAAAYPPLALVAAGALVERRALMAPARRRAQTAFLAGAGMIALALIGAGHATDRLGVPPRLDPTTRLRGWRELGLAVSTLRREMPRPERTFLLSDRYQLTSELAFYVESRPPAYNVNLGRRLNQYDFWEGPNARLGWDAIYVRDGVEALDLRVSAAFERIDGPSLVEVRRGGRVVRTFALYRGYGFRGFGPPSGPTTY